MTSTFAAASSRSSRARSSAAQGAGRGTRDARRVSRGSASRSLARAGGARARARRSPLRRHRLVSRAVRQLGGIAAGARRDSRSRSPARHVRAGERRDARPRGRHARRDARDGVGREAAREAGLEPAGDDGTFFQWWPMRRTRLSDASQIAIGGRALALWRDVSSSTAPVTADVDLPLVFVGERRQRQTSTCTARRWSTEIHAPTHPPAPNMSLRGYRYALARRSAAVAGAHRARRGAR